MLAVPILPRKSGKSQSVELLTEGSIEEACSGEVCIYCERSKTQHPYMIFQRHPFVPSKYDGTSIYLCGDVPRSASEAGQEMEQEIFDGSATSSKVGCMTKM